MESMAPVVQKQRSFLSTLAWGVSLTAVAVVISGTAVIVYGMNIADRKSDNLLGFVEEGIRSLPHLRSSLPPVLADLVDDRRQLDYIKHLDVSVRLVPAAGGPDAHRPVIELTNRGDETITLLSMRVVVLDEVSREPIAEVNEWAATPIAADHDWRGPLLPGSRRFLASRVVSIAGTGARRLRGEVEVTDLRVWNNVAGSGKRSREL